MEYKKYKKNGWVESVLLERDLNMKWLFLSVAAYSALIFSVVAGGEEIVFSDGFDTVKITSLSASPNPVEEGQSTTLSWTTVSADSCEATSASDAFNGPVATSGSVPLTIATAGSHNYTLVCTGLAGPAIETLTIIVSDEPVSITSFSASLNPVEQGQETTISWATLNATSCNATAPFDEFNGPVETSGSVVMTFATVGSFNFTLTCQGPSGPAIEVLTIVVEEAISVTECDPSPLTGKIDLWADLWGIEFPKPTSADVTPSVFRSGYLAIKFNTADTVGHGGFITIGVTQTDGVRTGVISECPGEFTVAPECYKRWGTSGGLGWATDGTAGACQLKPATTYYFNLTFTNGFDPSTSTCTTFRCESRIHYQDH